MGLILFASDVPCLFMQKHPRASPLFLALVRAVQVPASLGGATGDITDLDVIETICYGIIVNNELIKQYEDSQSPDSVSTVFTYFGAWNGVMRTFPGMNFDGSECGDYDPRVRPW